MATAKQLKANRQNARKSTGPTSAEGRAVVKSNALRDGIRAVQTVVPGESPDDWNSHRNAIVADLAPNGVMELVLAEQVAAALWRLGRVQCFESDMIAVGQHRDELAHDHEIARTPCNGGTLGTTDIPTRRDLEIAQEAAKAAIATVSALKTALGQLEALAGMDDGELLEDWSIYEPLRKDLRLKERETAQLFDGDEPFVVRHVRAMLRLRGPIDQITASMVIHWRDEKLPKLDAKAATAQKEALSVRRRYESALDRRSRAKGLPDEPNLAKVTR